MVHHEIEFYVDDIIARSQTKEDHLDHMQKLFERLKKYKLRLNPSKCTFGVRFGKLLGFVVSGKGIEFDSAKVIYSIHVDSAYRERSQRFLRKTELHCPIHFPFDCY